MDITRVQNTEYGVTGATLLGARVVIQSYSYQNNLKCCSIIVLTLPHCLYYHIKTNSINVSSLNDIAYYTSNISWLLHYYSSHCFVAIAI